MKNIIIAVFLITCIASCTKVDSPDADPPRVTPRNESAFSNCRFLLTIDDGPSRYTKDILSKLEQRQYLGVFFMTAMGESVNLDIYKKTIQDVIDNGHIIGNHTKSHNLEMLRHATHDTVRSDIQFINEYFKRNFNYNLKLFRPPFGVQRKSVLPRILDEFVMVNILWTIDICDVRWYNKPYDEKYVESLIVKQIRNMRDKKDHVVLLHSIAITSRNLDSIINILERYGKIVTKEEDICDIADYQYNIVRR